jgi:hypothetical protein
MNNKVLTLWGVAIALAMIASTLGNRNYPTSSPLQSILLGIAAFFFFFPIFVGVLMKLLNIK